LATGADFQAQLTDIAAAITQSFSKDGQTPMTGSLPMNNNSIIGVAAGTAAGPSISPTGDTNTGVYFPAADQVAISTGGAQRVVVDASGNVGVGVTPSSAPSGTSIQFGPPASGLLFCDSNNTNLASNAYFDTTWKYQTTGVGSSRFAQLSGGYGWYSAPAGTAGSTIPFGDPEMTLDTSGRLLLNTTGSIDGRMTIAADTVNSASLATTNNGLAAYYAGIFYHNGTYKGTITVTSTGTQYTSNSDYRLKKNVRPIANALDRVALLKPCAYDWKIDNSEGEGFIAHELAEVCPNAVSGKKDAVRIVDIKDDDGNVIGTEEQPEYQGIDTSFVVPLLAKAIQEQQALIEKQQSLIESLTARIAALEAK
jgi:hypothetical protein